MLGVFHVLASLDDDLKPRHMDETTIDPHSEASILFHLKTVIGLGRSHD